MNHSNKKRVAIFILVLVVLLFVSFKLKGPSLENNVEKSAIAEEVRSPDPYTIGEIREDRSTQFLINYATPSSSVEKDMENAWFVVESFNLLLKHQGSLPMGSNREIMNLLFGKNPRKVRFVDPTKSYINENGELLDRWNTPLFFHFVEGMEIAIRSAGVDQVMWTEDDVAYGDYARELK